MIKRIVCVVGGSFLGLSVLMSPQDLPAYSKNIKNVDQRDYAKGAFQSISFKKKNAQGDILTLSAHSAHLKDRHMVVKSPIASFKKFTLTSKQACVDADGHEINLRGNVFLKNDVDDINLTSNQLNYNHQTGYVFGTEGIKGSIDNTYIVADNVEYNPTSKILNLKGNVSISSNMQYG